MQKKICRAILAVGISGGLLLTSCGTGNHVDIFPVSGKITFDGKPMEGGGGISFIPLEGQSGKTAGGIIDAGGRYVMGTYSSRDGSMAGEFRVVITQVTQAEPENEGDGVPAGQPRELVPADRRIPPIYSNFKDSPLTIRVEEGKNEVNFDLTRQK